MARVTVGKCAGSRKHVCLTKHSGTRKKGGLTAGPHEKKHRPRDGSAAQVHLPQRPSLLERVCTRLQHMHARKFDALLSLLAGPP